MFITLGSCYGHNTSSNRRKHTQVFNKLLFSVRIWYEKGQLQAGSATLFGASLLKVCYQQHATTDSCKMIYEIDLEWKNSKNLPFQERCQIVFCLKHVWIVQNVFLLTSCFYNPGSSEIKVAVAYIKERIHRWGCIIEVMSTHPPYIESVFENISASTSPGAWCKTDASTHGRHSSTMGLTQGGQLFFSTEKRPN